MIIFTDIWDWAALGWFLMLWGGYTWYAKHRARTTDSLSAVLHRYREDWMQNMLSHEMRIADITILNNLMQMGNFFASTTILVIAGCITVLYSTDSMLDLLSDHTFIPPTTKEEVQFKFLILTLIFTFAFFRFTWAMRRHSFCVLLLGAAPVAGKELTLEEKEFAAYAARISDRAGHEFNYGLRAYYFALSLLSWFISPFAFMGAAALIVLILYRREFRSTSLKYLILARTQMIKAQQDAVRRNHTAVSE